MKFSHFLSLFMIKFSLLILLHSSTNIDPNQVIFDYVDSSWSSLSKKTNVPNFSPLIII